MYIPKIVNVKENCRLELNNSYPELMEIFSDKVTDDTMIIVDNTVEAPWVIDNDTDFKGIIMVNINSFGLIMSSVKNFCGSVDRGVPLSESAMFLINQLIRR